MKWRDDDPFRYMKGDKIDIDLVDNNSVGINKNGEIKLIDF